MKPLKSKEASPRPPCDLCGSPSVREENFVPLCDSSTCAMALVAVREANLRPRSESWRSVAVEARRYARAQARRREELNTELVALEAAEERVD